MKNNIKLGGADAKRCKSISSDSYLFASASFDLMLSEAKVKDRKIVEEEKMR